jgi:D-threo-aldose 1-dehydrogenase
MSAPRNDRKSPIQLERRRVGETGLEISIVGLGTAPLGGLFRPSSSNDAFETISTAFAAGVNFIDVAPQYGKGLAERRVGEVLDTVLISDLVLSTKVGRLLEPSDENEPLERWPEALSFSIVYDATPDGIRRSCDESIGRLGGRRPDMLLLHDPDRYAGGAELVALIEQAYLTLASLREEGSVAAIGIGVNAPEPCLAALDIGRWDCFLLAGSYSVLRQEDRGLLDRCLRDNVSALIGGPYMSGALAGGDTWRYRPIPGDIAADIARLGRICRRHAVPMQAAALQFPLLHPAVSSIVVGMRSADEVSQNIGFLHKPVPQEFWRDLVAERLISDADASPATV